jgi:hypothetical protein
MINSGVSDLQTSLAKPQSTSRVLFTGKGPGPASSKLDLVLIPAKKSHVRALFLLGCCRLFLAVSDFIVKKPRT